MSSHNLHVWWRRKPAQGVQDDHNVDVEGCRWMKRLMDSVIRSEVVGLSGVGAELAPRCVQKTVEW